MFQSITMALAPTPLCPPSPPCVLGEWLGSWTWGEAHLGCGVGGAGAATLVVLQITTLAFIDVTFNNQWVNSITAVWATNGDMKKVIIPSGQSRQRIMILSSDSQPKPLLFKLKDNKFGNAIKINGDNDALLEYSNTLQPIVINVPRDIGMCVITIVY